jgi:hypothetical protein
MNEFYEISPRNLLKYYTILNMNGIDISSSTHILLGTFIRHVEERLIQPWTKYYILFDATGLAAIMEDGPAMWRMEKGKVFRKEEEFVKRYVTFQVLVRYYVRNLILRIADMLASKTPGK